MKKISWGWQKIFFHIGLVLLRRDSICRSVGCFNGGEDGLRGYFEWHVVEGVVLCACGFGYFHELVVGYVSGTEFSQGDWETDFDAP